MSQPDWVHRTCKARMHRVGVVCKIVVLEPKLFPAEVAGKGNNISNQLKMVKVRIWGEGEAFR